MSARLARAGAAAAITMVAAGLACSPPPNILPTNDFNRPTDIAFMCLGEQTDANGQLQLTGQPMGVCHPPVAASTQPDPGQAKESRTFAFMTNSGSDDLSVVDADNWRVVDLDPENGLYGRLPLGNLPEQLSATDDGCRLVTANRGSCDFSLVDPAVLLTPTFQAQYQYVPPQMTSPTTARQQIVPRTPDGTPLDAEAYEVVFLPEETPYTVDPSTGAMSFAQSACPTAGVAPVAPWRALATFPACDLVALIDFPSGNIVQALKLEDDGQGGVTFADAGTTFSCPSECGAERGGTSAPAISSARFRPSGIAIVPGPAAERRAYISLASSPNIVAIGLPSNTFASGASGPSATLIPLHETDGNVGSTRIRLSVNPYRYHDASVIVPGTFVGSPSAVVNRRYLYVLLGDGTLRIVDVHDQTDEGECETNVDPAAVPTPPDSCTRYDAKKIGIVRRPLLVGAGPGIRFPGILVDVAAADIRPQVGGADDQSEATVGGAHAWVLTTAGNVYLVNIDPVLRTLTTVVQSDPQTSNPNDPVTVDPQNSPFVVQVAMQSTPGVTNPTLELPPYPASVRNRNVLSYSTALDAASGPPRIPVPPSTLVTGPYLETFWANGTRNNAFALSVAPPTGTSSQFVATPVYFQDTSSVTAQTWTVTWEGALVPGSYSGKVVGSTLTDGGANFCSSGVQLGDMLTFTGCTADSQCLPGFICHIDPTVSQAAGGMAITGLCVTPSDEADRVSACPDAFQTLRRYEITKATANTLDLAPHLDELELSSLTKCEDLHPPKPDGGPEGGSPEGGADGGSPDGANSDGGVPDDGSVEAGAAEAGAPVVAPPAGALCNDENDPTTNGFTCQQHPDESGGKNRCLQTCKSSSECRAGRVCLSGGTRGGFCADAPYLAVPQNSSTTCTSPSSILDQLVTYKVNAAGSYLVSGTATGMLASNATNANNECIPFSQPFTPPATPDPNAAPLRDWRLVARIPIAQKLAVDAYNNPTLVPVTECRVLDNHDDNTIAPPPMPTQADPMPNLESESRLKPLRAYAPNLYPPNRRSDPTLQGNPCLFEGGPIPAESPIPPSTPTMQIPQHVRAFFENNEISFVLANVDRAPAGQLTIPFDVNGGSGLQFVIYPATVEVSEAARIFLGPIDSLSQTTSPPPAFEAPYLFVVDQRRLGRSQGGGPTRGQLVRINPIGYAATIGTATGVQPIYEDYTRSGNLFPIQ
jgi:hypothetical protein